MKYNLKTGRFYFGIGDRVRDFKSVNAKSKTYRVINPDLYTKRLRGKYNTNKRFADLATDTGAFYNTVDGTTRVERIITKEKRNAFLKCAFSYTLSVAVMLVMLLGSVQAAGIRISDEAIVAGESVGIIADRAQFEEFLNEVGFNLSKELGREIKEFYDIRYVKKIVLAGDITNDYVLERNLRSICSEMTEGYSIYADDEYIASAVSKDTAEQALSQLKEMYKTDDPSRENLVNEFVQKIEIRSESVPSSSVLDGEALAEALRSSKTEPKIYTVREGENIWSIASKFDMSVEDLKKANPGITGDVSVGDELNVAKSLPVISIRTSYVQKAEKSIPYTNERIDDPELFAGATEVVTEGVKGRKNVVESIIEYNGEIVARKVESEEILQQPTPGVIRVGSKVSDNTGSGLFIRPTEGVISSRFGARWGRIHYGIDIAAPKGQPILAADDGVVETAELLDSWGNLVIIDHGEGVKTYYAHCNEFVATVGQNVKQGDIIAKVGSTGNSTGPHLHFEVRYNGTSINPEKFVNYQIELQ